MHRKIDRERHTHTQPQPHTPQPLNKRIVSIVSEVTKMDEKWYLEKIIGLEASVGKLIEMNGKLLGKIISLAGEMIDLKRFYLAFKISQCKECNVEVIDWESPIIFRDVSWSDATVASNGKSICEKHQKELDEFNRKHASD